MFMTTSKDVKRHRRATLQSPAWGSGPQGERRSGIQDDCLWWHPLDGDSLVPWFSWSSGSPVLCPFSSKHRPLCLQERPSQVMCEQQVIQSSCVWRLRPTDLAVGNVRKLPSKSFVPAPCSVVRSRCLQVGWESFHPSRLASDCFVCNSGFAPYPAPVLL